MGIFKQWLGVFNCEMVICPKCKNACPIGWDCCDQCGTTLIAPKTDAKKKKARLERAKAELAEKRAKSKAIRVDKEPSSLVIQPTTPSFRQNESLCYGYEEGVKDISLMENLPHLFNLKSMRYVKFPDMPYNQYLFDGDNQTLVKELVSLIFDSLQKNVKLIATLTPERFEFEPRMVRYWDGFENAEQCNHFCFLEDTRFTRTGKVSKNAYKLHFYDKTILSEREPQTYGHINLQGSLLPNRGQFIQWKPTRKGHFDILVVYFKMVNNQVFVTGVEKNGRNVLNT